MLANNTEIDSASSKSPKQDSKKEHTKADEPIEKSKTDKNPICSGPERQRNGSHLSLANSRSAKEHAQNKFADGKYVEDVSDAFRSTGEEINRGGDTKALHDLCERVFGVKLNRKKLEKESEDAKKKPRA